MPLPGSPQTVPRSELFAVLALVRLLSPDSICHVVSDSIITVNGIRSERRTGANSDLWSMLWKTVLSKRIHLTAEWVKAHTLDDPSLLKDYPTSPERAFGNACADKLADRAALVADLSPEEYAPVKALYALVQQVQKRLIAILQHLVENFPRCFSRPRLVRQPAPLLSSLVLSSAHTPVCFSKSIQCITCLMRCVGSSARSFQGFLSSPCMGTPVELVAPSAVNFQPRLMPPALKIFVAGRCLHPSHTIRVWRGLYFCTSCGCIAGHNVKKLGAICTHLKSRQGFKNLKCIAEDKRPHGTPSWPSSDQRCQQVLLHL